MNVNQLLQFLWEGDILGFLQALYVSSFQSSDLFYGVLAMIFSLALYIRTWSLPLLSILWILVGSILIVAMPIVSGLAVLLMILGFAGALYMAFMRIRG